MLIVTVSSSAANNLYVYIYVNIYTCISPTDFVYRFDNNEKQSINFNFCIYSNVKMGEKMIFEVLPKSLWNIQLTRVVLNCSACTQQALNKFFTIVIYRIRLFVNKRS